MKEDKILFLCTTGYPFGIIEDFLHSEVVILAEKFKKIVLIVPYEATHLPKRKLPINVEIAIVGAGNSFNFLIKSSFWTAIISDCLIRELNIFNFSKLRVAFSYFKNATRIKGAIEKQIDSISEEKFVFYSYWFNESALALSLIKSKSKYRHTFCVIRAHGWDVYKERHTPNYLPFRKWITDKADLILPVSNFGANYLKVEFRLPENKIAVHYLGTKKIESPAFSKSSAVRLLSCSNVIPLKRIELIIKSLSLLSCDIEWTHIGDGVEMEKIQNLAKSKLGENIKYFFKGQLSNKAVRELYASEAFDLFINVSETEGLPVSMMEVICIGIPIIGTNVGGVSEIILNDKTGWLIDKDNVVEELIHSINSYIELSEKRKKALRVSAMHYWEQNFNAEKNYNYLANELINS